MNEAAFISLRQENERLAAENAYLKALYQPSPDVEFLFKAKAGLGITTSLARILHSMWHCRQTSKEAIADFIWGAHADERDIKGIDVQVCRLRKALYKIDAGLKTVWGVGYQLLPADRAKIAAHIGIEVQP